MNQILKTIDKSKLGHQVQTLPQFLKGDTWSLFLIHQTMYL